VKKLFLSLFGLFALSTINAQEIQTCGTDEHNDQIFSENPGLRDLMNEHLTRVTSGAYNERDRADECIIPVVVHVLHDNGIGNISFEQIQSGIDQLNEDFNRENPDAVATRDTDDAPFLSAASDMNIRFELAKIDPDGNCTNGVERRSVGSFSYNASNAQKHFSTNGLDAWNRNYYMNIWVANSVGGGGGGGIVLGYAEFPYSGGSSNFGVMMRHDTYGSVGTASGNRTLTHEVGHCLGLLHTFQGGCHSGSCDSNGDFCCDTPPVTEPQWSCSGTQNNCTAIPAGDPYGFDALDQFENFMSYSPCQNMFSKDQANIVLSNLESIGMFVNLISEDHNLEAGVGTPATLCKAQFTSEINTTCAGNTIQFFDDSYSNVTARTWTFEGGTPATSTEENPVITFDTPGNYAVTLEVTDGASTETITSENHILVLPVPGRTLPYSQDFESLSSIPDNDHFLILDEDGEDYWVLNDEVGHSGTKSAFLSNRGNDNLSKDALISGTIDLSSVDEADDVVFNFKYAYRRRTSSTDEWIRFFISNDCGETWVLRKNIHGNKLSEEIQPSSYTPADKSEWFQVNITNINSAYYTSNFRFKIEFENDNGNNIYIDDINMYAASTASIENDDVNAFGLSVYPNPLNDIMNVSLTLKSETDVTVNVLNALGQEISSVYSGVLPAGNNLLTHNTNELPSGVYFLSITAADGTSQPIRFVKE